MNNWKAITAGAMTTITLVLITQLIFILIASFIGGAKGEFAFLSDNKELLWRAVALLSFCLSMGMGGMATALFSRINPVRNAVIVGGLVSGLSVLTSLANGELTMVSGLLVLFGIVFAGIGAMIWKRKPN